MNSAIINQPYFWRNHFHIPLLVLLVATLLVQIMDLDLEMALWLYRLEGAHWVLQDHWMTSRILHKDGKHFSLLLAIFLFITLCVSFINSKIQPYRLPMAYVLFTAIFSAVMVNILKSSLAVSCPWDFDNLGGSLPYSPLWQQLWLRNGSGCFPAGHASSGYAWIGLYFIGFFYQSPWRWVGLGVPLVMGILFGVAQQLRGAHFITHDLWTLGICWFCAFLLFIIFFRSYSWISYPVRHNQQIKGLIES